MPVLLLTSQTEPTTPLVEGPLANERELDQVLFGPQEDSEQRSDS